MDQATVSDREIEAQYNPRVAVPGFEAELAEFARLSEGARRRLAARYDVAYGPSPLQTADVYPAERARAPIHVFIHGGYWRALDKRDHAFIAEPLVGAGATAVLINYDLCPAVTVDEVVAQARAAVGWVFRNAESLGGDPDRLFISGHSAGAHLAVMAMSHDWEAEGLPADPIKGVAAVSGIYDLAPVLKVSVNEDIRLTPEMAERNSPMREPPSPGASLLVAVGGGETPAWIRQSEAFHAACAARGVYSTFMRAPGLNHFAIGRELGRATSPLVGAILAQMGLAPG